MNQELWKPDNKEWMKERKEEWKHIVKSLDAIGYISKKHYKYHKDYFFKGPASIDEELLSPRVFDSGIVLFKMWYHPEKSLEAYKKIFNACPYLQAQNAIIRFNDAAKQKLGGRAYGLLGGREKLIINAVFPSYDYNDVAYCVQKNGHKIGPLHLAPSPERCLREFLNGLTLFCYENKNIYSPGQYFIDHLDHAIDKIDFSDTDEIRDERERLIQTLYIIKHQAKYPRFLKDNQMVVEIANGLKQRFENRDFGPTLMNYWDNIDELYKENLD